MYVFLLSVKAGAQVVSDNVKYELFIIIGNDVGLLCCIVICSRLPVAAAAPAGAQPGQAPVRAT